MSLAAARKRRVVVEEVASEVEEAEEVASEVEVEVETRQRASRSVGMRR
jgi:hypothetical protein|tara:strand:- start:363 stop:509 length:147 start_codon:yes stop_codon:yes gene_type:complete